MDPNETSISCAINIDWLNAQGVSIRKIVHKFGTLRLIRNELREMFVEISTDKTKPIKLHLSGIVVHKKFMSEGKASIKFNNEKCILFLSNAPPGTLMTFLKTLFIKMTGEVATAGTSSTNSTDKSSSTATQMQKTIRAHMLNGRPSKFEDISPITNADLMRAKKLNGIGGKSSVTIPSPLSKKRDYDTMVDGEQQKSRNPLAPACKRLYNSAAATSTATGGNGNLIKNSLDSMPIVNHVLNEEQEEVYRSCLSGKNVFFTGSAGTGKSFLLRKIISALPPDGTMATASTGVAACLIGGATLHSFAGIGGGDASIKRCYELASRPVCAQVWRKCKILIIDEISMVDGEYFEKIENVARYIRRNDKPFGGIQLILCGDFLQLPPVIKNFENNRFGLNQQIKPSLSQSKRFCFQSPAWQNVINVSYELKKVHRQKDMNFVKILNLLRIGHVNDEITKRLLATSSQKIESNGILATQLCSHTKDAILINESKLEKLTTESKTFDSIDSDPTAGKQLDSQIPAPGKLELKIGAQVMLLKNINVSDGLVNGARGVVIRFVGGTTPSQQLPVVRFKTNREYLIKPEKWMIKMPTGGLLVRKQIPLKLAWAFSIHKSQGLTLDCVEMSLSKVFEAGQAYVALSRVQSLESLRVLDFDGKQVWADPEVLQFYKMFRRQLHDQTFIPLGGAGRKKSTDPSTKQTINGIVKKISKSLMNKPLVNIC